MLFHLAIRGDWDEAATTGSYEMSTVGRTLAQEGFIHASYADQVAGTAERFYAGRDDLVLLTIDPALLGCEVRVEGGFPHLYGPLPVGAVVSAEPWRSPSLDG